MQDSQALPELWPSGIRLKGCLHASESQILSHAACPASQHRIDNAGLQVTTNGNVCVKVGCSGALPDGTGMFTELPITAPP